MDDEAIGAMNAEYFDKNGPTDVIAFSLHGADEPVLGDVYLGYQQAGRQAEELGIPLEEELLRLTIHGTLHVVGYRHPEGDERFETEMYQKQEALLESLVKP
jgi:probable rRNA maturation factor